MSIDSEEPNCPHGYPEHLKSECAECSKGDAAAARETSDRKETQVPFNKSRYVLIGAEILEDKYNTVLAELEKTFPHEVLNKFKVEFISVEPSSRIRPDGTIRVGIRNHIDDIISQVHEGIKLASELHTQDETQAASPQNIRPERETPQPESQSSKTESRPESSSDKEIQQWEEKYGFRLIHIERNIKPEVLGQNLVKLNDVFQKISDEKGNDRLQRSSFNLVDSGGSGKKEGWARLDVTEDPDKIFEFLVKNTGRGF